MRPGDIKLGLALKSKLLNFHKQVHPLPGIRSKANMDCFVEQVIDSIRRIKYIEVIRDKPQSKMYADPDNIYFDPQKGASYYKSVGFFDEACWLVFLLTHFGKNKQTGWNLVRQVYMGPNNNRLTWDYASQNLQYFLKWLSENEKNLKHKGGFGNHRKYQSIDAYSSTGTGVAIGSYIEWIGESNSHRKFFDESKEVVGNDPKKLFEYLYHSLDQVVSFGRTAKFDYLTMIGKFKLVDITPNLTYMSGATGPRRGANLLFFDDIKANSSINLLESLLNTLDDHLNQFFGMQVLEDSLCNWQKSPSNFIHFSG